MQARDFCFWLQGFFELAEQGIVKDSLTVLQVEMIKQHLDLVFKHDIKRKELEHKVPDVTPSQLWKTFKYEHNPKDYVALC